MARRLPVWLLGLANIPLGVTGAVALLIAPQVLAARHVPETTIATVTTLGLAGTMVFFLVAPILDGDMRADLGIAAAHRAVNESGDGFLRLKKPRARLEQSNVIRRQFKLRISRRKRRAI